MTTKSEKKFRESLKLFIWSGSIAVVSSLMIFAGFNWVHSIALIAVGAVLAPVAAFVALFMGLMLVAIRLDMRK
jgi:hypothetical protein